MAAAEKILDETLESSGIIDGVTCGAGMPYKLSEIAANYGVFIIQSYLRREHSMLYGKDHIGKLQSFRWSCI